jgi:hypothetical protein
MCQRKKCELKDMKWFTGKVEIGAFRTYPADYTPPNAAKSEYQPIPLNKIEDFGVHADRYYQLDLTIFKTSLDSRLIDLLASSMTPVCVSLFLDSLSQLCGEFIGCMHFDLVG